jgi:hypothetical protein
MKKEKRIPTILGLILLLGSVVGGVILTNRNGDSRSKASGDCKPINPQITNITDTSFSVSFTTQDNCLSELAMDNMTVRDIKFINTGKTETAGKLHYFEVNNLKEITEYQFSLVSNGTKYTHPNYKTKTAKKPANTIPTSNLAWGRVYTSDLKPAADTIVYLNINGASPLSAVVTSKGYWNISLANSFNIQKDGWFSPPANQNEDLMVMASDGQVTQISNNTSRNNPVPDIILGQNKFSDQPVTEYGSEGEGYIDSVPTVTVERELSVTNPKENEAVFTSRPDIFGMGPIGKTVHIQLVSKTVIQGDTDTLKDGSWHWSPSVDLAPGEVTLMVSAQKVNSDEFSSITRKFNVVGQGNVGLAFTASGSGNMPTNTPTPTLVPTYTPTNAPTVAPTVVPTLVPTVKPTKAATIAPTKKPTKTSTTSAMPVTGTATPTFILVGLAIVFIIASYIYL